MKRVFLLTVVLLAGTSLCFLPAGARDVRVALPELPPSTFIDEQGEPAGLFVDLIKDIAVGQGWTVTWVPGTLTESWDRLASGEIDLLPGVVNTTERWKLYDFNREPALSAWSQVYAPGSSGISTFLDLDGKRVALLKGDVSGIVFRDNAEKFDINVTFIEKDALSEVFGSAAAGETDALVAFSMAGEISANKYGLAETPVMFNPTAFHFAAKKGKNADLLQAIDRYLAEGKDKPQSAYSTTMQKWFGMKGASQVIPAYVWGSLAAIGGFAILFVGMIFVLRREVKRKTAELVRKNEELSAANQQLTAIEEELRHNYQNLSLSEQALLQARKKLNLLNRLTFQEIQSGIFSVAGYFQLVKSAGCNGAAQSFLGKGEAIIRSVENSLHFAKKYQDLGINMPRWQDVNYVLISAISHLDVTRISRTVEIDDLFIYADPMLEDVFVTIMEIILSSQPKATEVAIRCHKSGKSVIITVEDNGQGISKEDKEAIFEWEYRGKGGPGLFLAREILSITGITITETGTPGAGARFELTVPEGGYRLGSDEEKDPGGQSGSTPP